MWLIPFEYISVSRGASSSLSRPWTVLELISCDDHATGQNYIDGRVRQLMAINLIGFYGQTIIQPGGLDNMFQREPTWRGSTGVQGIPKQVEISQAAWIFVGDAHL